MWKRFLFIVCSVAVICSILVFSCFAADQRVIYDYRQFYMDVRTDNSFAKVDIEFPLNVGRYYVKFEDGSYVARNYQEQITWYNSAPGLDTELRFYPIGTANMGLISTDFLQNNSKCSVSVDLRIFNFDDSYLTEFSGITCNLAYFDKNYQPISTQTVDMYDMPVEETETMCTFFVALPPGAAYYHFYVTVPSVSFAVGNCRFYCAYFNVQHDFTDTWWSFTNVNIPQVDIDGSGSVEDVSKLDGQLFDVTAEGRNDFLTLVSQSQNFLTSLSASFVFFNVIFTHLLSNPYFTPLLVFSMAIGSFALLMGLFHSIPSRDSSVSRSYNKRSDSREISI